MQDRERMCGEVWSEDFGVMTEQIKVKWNVIKKDDWYALVESFCYGTYYNSDIVCECRDETYLLEILIPQRKKELELAAQQMMEQSPQEIDNYFQHKLQNRMRGKRVYPQRWEDET